MTKFNEDGVESIIDSFDRGYGNITFDSMRLLSLYGNPDKSLEFRVNAYSDGSGSDSPVAFFKSKEEGLAFMQTEFDNVKQYSENYLDIAEKYSLKIDSEKFTDVP